MSVTLKLKPGERPRVMAILNLTPDSFYANSRYDGVASALAAAEQFVEEGADILDIGAESSRPGSSPIDDQEELERLAPVVEAVCKRVSVPISVDTRKPVVARAVLDLGAMIINDITGLTHYPELAEVVASYDASLILMHMKGTPQTMQDAVQYEDLFGEIKTFLGDAISKAEEAGVDPAQIAIDPGIGFGKTVEHNCALIAGLNQFKSFEKAIVLGASRKSFIGKILDAPAEDRLEGSLSAALIGMFQGADVLRVHDVASTVKLLKTAQAILAQGN